MAAVGRLSVLLPYFLLLIITPWVRCGRLNRLGEGPRRGHFDLFGALPDFEDSRLEVDAIPKAQPSASRPPTLCNAARPSGNSTLLFVNAGGLPGHRLVNWLRGLEVSPDVVGMCELQGWSAASLRRHACEAGYDHSTFLPTPSGFHIGVMARSPLDVVGRHVEGFQRGVLHIKVGGTNYVVAHLHAQSDVAHYAEVALLSKYIEAVEGEPLLLAGDLNMLSPVDGGSYRSEGLQQTILRRHMTILEHKYLDQSNADGPNGNVGKSLDFSPMKALLGVGLRDACIVKSSERRRIKRSDDQCWPTEPTSIPNDQVPSGETLPPTRVMYILVNAAAAARCDEVTGGPATALRDAETSATFDHYPIWYRGCTQKMAT